MTEHHDPQQPFRGVGGEGVPSTGATDEEELAAARIANRFDIRRIIGGLFVVYAAVLIVTGIVGGDEVKNKAAGVNINLWTGLGMLVVGVLMIVWALARPVVPEPAETRGRGSGRIRRAPAT
ncbi:MAG TPA: hypothetical protein VF257_00430 [Solirubrobacteraceae bacterium]